MAAVTADSVIVELEAHTAEYDAAMQKSGQTTIKFGSDAARGASQAEGAVVGSLKRIDSSSGNTNGAQLILQSVIRRTTDQFAAGAPLATIFAEHISAIAEAGELAGGAMGSFGALLQGPLGLALSATVSVAAILGGKLLEGADDTEKLKDKTLSLEDALSKARFATDAAAKSIAAYNAEQKHAIDSDSLAASNALALAEARLKEARANIAAIQADLQRQRGVQPFMTNGIGGNPALAADAVALDRAKASAKDLDQTVRNLEINIGEAASKAAADPLKRINDQFDFMRDKAKRAASVNDVLAKSITGTLSAIEIQRKAALDAQRALDRHSRSADAVAEANAKLATATDEVGRAEARVELVRAQRSKLTPAAYQAELTAALGAVNAARAHEAAVKSDTKALAAFNAENAKLVLGLIRTNAEMGRGILPDAGKEFKDVADDLARIQHENVEEQGAAREQLHRKQEQSIRTLSGLYYDLFSGGTKNLWDDFKRLGEEALAKLAAKKTFELIGNLLTAGSGGGLGSIFHLAAGGVFDVGGAGGVDKNLLSINGVPRAAVSASEKIAVIPQGSMIASPASFAGGGTTIVNAPQFHLAGAVVTTELYEDMQRISNISATRAGLYATQAGAAKGKKDTLIAAARPSLPRAG